MCEKFYTWDMVRHEALEPETIEKILLQQNCHSKILLMTLMSLSKLRVMNEIETL